MKRRGFTLVEVIAVLIILTIIFVILAPSVSEIIKGATKNAFEIDAKRVLEQLEYKSLKDAKFDATTVNETNLSDFNISSSNYSNVKIGVFKADHYIIIEGKGKWANLKACGTRMDMIIVSATDTTTCQDIPVIQDYAEAEGVNKPKLITGMTPVNWVGTDWMVTTESDADWYNYTTTDKKWANAQTADGSFWVWIPRYAYQIESGYHTDEGGRIKIKFLKNKGNIAGDNSVVSTIPTYNGDAQTNYIVHPAFTFGSTEVSGIWVAKFESSGVSSAIESKPGALALKSEPIGNMFLISRNMETNNRYGWGTSGSGIDTHMMKNSEWAAVVYLSQSALGANDGIAQSLPSYTGGGVGNAYVTNISQSTTGNIYGLYDINGGNFEYVSAYIDNSYADDYGASITIADGKYKDKYVLGSSDGAELNYNANSNKFGDATYETSSNYNLSWTPGNSFMPNNSEPWFYRGGCNDEGSCESLFSMSGYTGNNIDSDANEIYTFRPIILIETGL